MKNREISKFSKNVKARRSKRIYSFLIDIFSEIILIVFLIGLVFRPIMNATPLGKATNEGLSNSNSVLQNITLDSGLNKVSEGDENIILSSDELSDDYVKRILNTYLFLNDVSVNDVKISINQTVFVENETNFKGDAIAYYFLEFKKDNNIGSTSDKSTYASYFYDEVIGIEVSEKFFNKLDDSSYRILNDEAANYLKKYIYENDDTNFPLTYYNELVSLFNNAHQKGIEDLETNYSLYQEELEVYLAHYQNYATTLIISIVLSYVFAHIILFFILPLCLKNLRTLGRKTFKISYILKNGYNVPFYKYLIYFLISFLKNIYAIVLPIFFLFGTLGIMSYPLFLGVTFTQFVIFSVLLSLLSFILSFILKSHVNLEEFALSLNPVSEENFDEKTVMEVSNGK